MPPTRIGFLGAGDIATLHGAAIAGLPSAELVGLWSIDESLNREKAALFGCRTYPSAEALVTDSGIDAVFVLTNVETHARYTELALRAGKHVLVEKPAAADLAELRRMKVLAEETERWLMPGHNYLHEPSLLRTKKLIDSGRLGDLAQIYILYNIHHPEAVAQRYPGVIRQLMIHHLYILLYLAGTPRRVSAMKAALGYEQLQRENLAMVNLRLAGGGLAHLAASFVTDDHSSEPWTFLVKVLGSKGATRFSYNDWVENAPAVVHSHTYSAYHCHIENEVRFFVEECLGKNVPPPSTIDDAITCQRIVEAIERSIDEAREVEIPA